jgi:mannonate dehydratase
MFARSNRRRFFETIAVAAAWPALGARSEELTGDVKLTMPANLSDESLSLIQQLGVEWVTMGGPGAPTYSPEGRVISRPGDEAAAGGPWTEQQLRDIQQRVATFGLKVGNLMLHDFRNVILGRPGRDEDIERVRQSIRVAGKAGVPVVEYNFYALRAMEGYYRKPGRAGIEYAAHDYDRSKDLPVLPDVGEHPADALWERYTYFLKAVVPVAQEAGVRLAVHPNDPPPPRYRGCDQILGSVEGLKRLVDIVRSPHNGITFDTGVTREMGHNPAEVIPYFGGRDQINHVHFRNVISDVPRLKYTEVFIDEGQVDMAAALAALRKSGYPRLLHPDHVPSLPGDERQRAGWGYAVGHIKGLLRQTQG